MELRFTGKQIPAMQPGWELVAVGEIRTNPEVGVGLFKSEKAVAGRTTYIVWTFHFGKSEWICPTTTYDRAEAFVKFFNRMAG